MNWLTKLMFAMFVELLKGVIVTIADFMNNIFSIMYELQNVSSLVTVRTYIEGIAISLVVVYGLKNLIDTYVLMNSGEIDEEPLDIIVRLSETIATIMCGSYVIDYLIEMAGKLADEVTSAQYDRFTALEVSTEETLSEKLTSLIALIVEPDISGFIQIIIYIVLVIAVIVYIIKAAKRGAELILFQLMLPLIAINKLSTSRDMWNNFKNELMTCIFGYIIQVFGFNEFLRILLGYPAGGNKVLFASLGWLMVATNAPKWLDKFISHTGIGSGAKGVGGMAAQAAIQKVTMRSH